MEALVKSVGEVSASCSVDRSGRVTIRELVSLYMAAYNGRDTTRAQRLQFWVAKLGDTTLSELDDDHIFHALEDLAAHRGRYFAGYDADGKAIFKAKNRPYAPATINRYGAALGAVLTWAIRRRIAPKGWTSPAKRVERKPENNEVVRFLSEAERIALLAACKASSWNRLYLFVLMALTTGARRGELEALRWGDVDFDRAEASIHRSKNGDRKVLPLIPAVSDELSRHRGANGALVFPSKRRPDVAFNNVPSWQLALRKASIRNFRFHDLRHSCASALAQNGATLLEIADVLGHRQLSVTRRYSHLAVDQKSKLINRVLGDIR